jgi:hypothetical protein
MAKTHWTNDRLTEIGVAEELVLVVGSPGREPLRPPVWPVRVGDDIYVRSYLGVTSRWFRRVQAKQTQAIELGGLDIPVVFENVDRVDPVNRQIDAAFDGKYEHFEYRSAMSEPAAVEATLRILPA